LIRNRFKASQLRSTGNIREDILQIFYDRDLMKEKWDMLQPVLKEKFYLDLIMQVHDRKTILEQTDRFKMTLPSNGLLVSVLEIDTVSSEMDIYSDYIESISISGIIENFLQDEKEDFFYVAISQKRIVLVTAMRIDKLLVRLDHIIRQIKKQLDLSVTVGTYNIPAGIEELNHAYQKALQTLPYKILFGSNKIILYSDIEHDMHKSYLYPKEQEHSLRIAIKIGNQEQADSIFYAMFGQLQEQQSYFAIQQFVYRMNAFLVELMEELSLPSRQSSLDTNLQSFDSLSEISNIFQKEIAAIIENTKKARDSRMDLYFERISSCIKENYNKNLSVEQICAEVRLSPTYVNQILKKYSGRSFVQYVNDYRIELSCELIRNPDIRIKDISEKLGFSSAKYFIKLFKDAKGFTPGEYRKQFELKAEMMEANRNEQV